MTILVLLALITVLLLWYAIAGREWLKSKPWGKAFLAWVEPVEILLFKKSETILLARLKIVSGFVLTLFTQVGAIDITPLMPLVPDKYRHLAQTAFNFIPLSISLLGWVDQSLRYATTKPVVLVAIPDKLVASVPAIANAVAAADAAKAEAVAIVKAKAA